MNEPTPACAKNDHLLANALVVLPGQHGPCLCGAVTIIVLADYGTYWMRGTPQRIYPDVQRVTVPV